MNAPRNRIVDPAEGTQYPLPRMFIHHRPGAFKEVSRPPFYFPPGTVWTDDFCAFENELYPECARRDDEVKRGIWNADMKRFFHGDAGERRWIERPYAQGHIEMVVPEIRARALRGKLVLRETSTPIRGCGDKDNAVKV